MSRGSEKKPLDIDVLERFHPAVRRWFRNSFPSPTAAQQRGWPAIAAGGSTLILAPTGSGKTLTAFLWCIDRLMFSPLPVETVDPETPSPFASSVLFRYVANYLYDGDAPLAGRRAHALGIDQSQLRELIGAIKLRELLDEEVLEATEVELQGLGEWRVRHDDDLHDLLLRLGDLER